MMKQIIAKTKMHSIHYSSDVSRPWALFAIAFMLLIPQIGWSEGNVMLLECKVMQSCNAKGSCEADSANVIFRMEPEELGPSRAGEYSIIYGDTRVEMEAISNVGPFYWTVGTERHTLVVSSETQWLWHQLMLEPAVKATIKFLSCSFEQ